MSFEKVLTVNTVYFWSALEGGLSEIYRMLTVGGDVAVGFLPKQKMDGLGLPKDVFTSRSPEEIVLAMQQVGFRNIRVKKPEIETSWNAIVGTR